MSVVPFTHSTTSSVEAEGHAVDLQADVLVDIAEAVRAARRSPRAPGRSSATGSAGGGPSNARAERLLVGDGRGHAVRRRGRRSTAPARRAGHRAQSASVQRCSTAAWSGTQCSDGVGDHEVDRVGRIAPRREVTLPRSAGRCRSCAAASASMAADESMPTTSRRRRSARPAGRSARPIRSRGPPHDRPGSARISASRSWNGALRCVAEAVVLLGAPGVGHAVCIQVRYK